MPVIKITKFDAAERQLFQAIRMFLRDEDPISIHTIAEAADQILSDISKDFGAISHRRETDIIKEEYRKEWLGYLFKSRNFFKHADRDKNDIHEFNTEINAFTIFDSVIIHTTIKKKWTPETLVFWSWFLLEYPQFIREGTEVEGMYNISKNNSMLPDPKNKELMADYIQMIRTGEIHSPGTTTEYGL